MDKTRLWGALAATLLVAACGGNSNGTTTGSTASGSTPTSLAFKADGTPNLKGLTIHLGNSAGDATMGDTVTYLTVEQLKKWGADADMTNGSGNTTDLAVISGQLNATAGPLATVLNAGLDIFGNNQVHVDYLMVSGKIADLASLKGRTVAIATAVSPDNYLLDGALAKAGLSRNDIKIAITGSNGNSVNQLAQGKVDVAFVHADALTNLQKNGTMNVIANGATLEPWDADTFMAATPAWLKANPATAEAIDLAWLHAAYVFDNQKSAWVQAAVAYTKGAITADEASVGYEALAKAQPWPADGTGMETANLQQNFDAANKSGQIKGQGNRPISDWLVSAPWTAAVAYFKKHPKAIEA